MDKEQLLKKLKPAARLTAVAALAVAAKAPEALNLFNSNPTKESNPNNELFQNKGIPSWDDVLSPLGAILASAAEASPLPDTRGCQPSFPEASLRVQKWVAPPLGFCWIDRGTGLSSFSIELVAAIIGDHGGDVNYPISTETINAALYQTAINERIPNAETYKTREMIQFMDQTGYKVYYGSDGLTIIRVDKPTPMAEWGTFPEPQDDATKAKLAHINSIENVTSALDPGILQRLPDGGARLHWAQTVLPGTLTPTPLVSRTPTPTTTPTSTVTKTATPVIVGERVGGKGLTIKETGGGNIELDWLKGVDMTLKYQLFRWDVTTGNIVTLPANTMLNATVSVSTDVPSGNDLVGYTLIQPDTGSRSDLLVKWLNIENGNSARNFSLTLNQSSRGVLRFDTPLNAEVTDYQLLRLSQAPQILPLGTNLVNVDLAGLDCFVVVTRQNGLTTGATNVLCGLPGFSQFNS